MANLIGYGQFGLSQLPSDRKGQADLSQDFNLLGKKNKGGFFGEGEKEISEIYFPAHRSEKDVLSSQFGVGNFGQNMPNLPRGMPTPQQQFPPRSLSSSHHGNLPGHVTPTSVSLSSGMQQMNPGSPSRGILSVGHRGLSSPNRTSPSLLAMHQKQQQQQQQQRAIGTMSGGYQDRTTPTSMNSFGISRTLILPQQNNLLSNINHQTIANSFNNATKTAPDWLQFNSNTRSRDQGSTFQFDHWSNETSPSLDLSDFPALANRGRQTDLSAFQLPNPMAGRPQYVGMVNKTAEPTPEFQIQNEDFPALPGSNNKQGTEQQNNNSMDSPRFPGDNSSKQSSNNIKKGVQIHPDGKITNIPAGMVTDPFGMVGLLTFIRAAETDANLVQLALGSDLTTLGLNLNSPENLYGTFQSPWADGPCRPQDIDFHVPSEYLTNLHIKDKLAPIKLSRYGEDLLFYLYYTHGGEVLQLAAAAELYNRDWRYHKDERVWITRGPGMEPSVKTNSYEMGMYYYFDCHRWCKVPKEFHLDYDKLEERPHLPASFHHNVSTNQVAH